MAGDVPVVGNWNGSDDEDPEFSETASGTSTPTETIHGMPVLTQRFPSVGDIPVVGDWNGSGTTKMEFSRTASGTSTPTETIHGMPVLTQRFPRYGWRCPRCSETGMAAAQRRSAS